MLAWWLISENLIAKGRATLITYSLADNPEAPKPTP